MEGHDGIDHLSGVAIEEGHILNGFDPGVDLPLVDRLSELITVANVELSGLKRNGVREDGGVGVDFC